MAHQIQIQDDLRSLLGQTSHRGLQECVLYLLRIVAELMAAGLFIITQFQPVERAGRGQRKASILQTLQPQRIALARRDGQERVQAQGVMIVEVFVAQSQSVQALGQ